MNTWTPPTRAAGNRRFTSFFKDGLNIKSFLPGQKNIVKALILPNFDWLRLTPDNPEFVNSYMSIRDPRGNRDGQGNPAMWPPFVFLLQHQIGQDGDKLISPASYANMYTVGHPHLIMDDPLLDILNVARDENNRYHNLTKQGSAPNNRTLIPYPSTRVVFNVAGINSNDPNDQTVRAGLMFGSKTMAANLEQLLNTPRPAAVPTPRDPDWPDYLYGDVTNPDRGLMVTTLQRQDPSNTAVSYTGLMFSTGPMTLAGSYETGAMGRQYMANRINIWTPDIWNILSYEQILEKVVAARYVPYDLIAEACGHKCAIPGAPLQSTGGVAPAAAFGQQQPGGFGGGFGAAPAGGFGGAPAGGFGGSPQPTGFGAAQQQPAQPQNYGPPQGQAQPQQNYGQQQVHQTAPTQGGFGAAPAGGFGGAPAGGFGGPSPTGFPDPNAGFGGTPNAGFPPAGGAGTPAGGFSVPGGGAGGFPPTGGGGFPDPNAGFGAVPNAGFGPPAGNPAGFPDPNAGFGAGAQPQQNYGPPQGQAQPQPAVQQQNYGQGQQPAQPQNYGPPQGQAQPQHAPAPVNDTPWDYNTGVAAQQQPTTVQQPQIQNPPQQQTVTQQPTAHTGVPPVDPAVMAMVPQLQQYSPGDLQELVNTLSGRIAEGTLSDEDKIRLKAASIVMSQRTQM